MPIILTSIQRRLDNLSIMEFADCSSRNSPQMIPEMMGFGHRPGAADCIHSPHAYSWFASSLQLIATAMGLLIESFEVHSDLALARNDVYIAAGLIHRGPVVATGTTLAAMRDGQEFLSFTSTWFVSTDVETSEGEEREFRTPSGWRVLLQGDCPLEIVISFPTPPENYAAMTPGLTANRPVHAIPFVCSAAPGIRTILDLPQIMTRLG